MEIDYNIQFDSKNKLKHFLNIELLSESHINQILDLAEKYEKNEGKKFDDLNGSTIASLFFEPSTRTKTTFELAAKRLSADFINIDIANSSTLKGESIKDMIKTLEAMSCDMFIVRHSVSGTSHYIASEVDKNISVINAGDGSHAHPTQAMLDMFTIRKHKSSFKNLKVSIVGDILHSRVAKSVITSLKILGVSTINIVGPKSLIPNNYADMGVGYIEQLEDGISNVDVIIMLRLQIERMHEALISTDDYFKDYGLTQKKLSNAKSDVIVMHPGPINRGVEIDSDVADGKNSVILDQVSSGISIRMAILSLILNNRK
ncbi:MAG: aspartate carbamoyltransferase catalytic subunit [Gammaproteobacteria bacterium]|nr:aspartate carbamoyltransferase catalytic subunit [Gammaproteobacteria bacterium]|tara:strand:- start:82396 stop:83346 length:951 start_codon:yes stop_codon:yes gene_type:complete